MLVKNYMINEKTMMFTGIYGNHGRLQTLVIETEKTFRVKHSAEQILQNTLRKVGTSLRGAQDYAKSHLGNVNMCPINVHSQRGLYFFPNKSPKRPDCIWFSLIHVKGASAIGKNKTKVYLSHKHSFIIDCALTSFNTKLNRALKLRKMMAEREGFPITYYLEPKFGIGVREVNEINQNFLNDDQKDKSRGQNENQ